MTGIDTRLDRTLQSRAAKTGLQLGVPGVQIQINTLLDTPVPSLEKCNIYRSYRCPDFYCRDGWTDGEITHARSPASV